MRVIPLKLWESCGSVILRPMNDEGVAAIKHLTGKDAELSVKSRDEFATWWWLGWCHGWDLDCPEFKWNDKPR